MVAMGGGIAETARGRGMGGRRGRLRVGRLRPPRDPDLKRSRTAAFSLWADPHSALVICPRIRDNKWYFNLGTFWRPRLIILRVPLIAAVNRR